MTAIATTTPKHQTEGWFRKAELWLDERGKAAWITAMVLGFVIFWPVGLALLFYMIWSNRMSNPMCSHKSRRRHHMMATRSTGNSAFDAYRADTLRRLEEEQDKFEEFLERLREAKDKSEFDQFMEERARAARAGTSAEV